MMDTFPVGTIIDENPADGIIIRIKAEIIKTIEVSYLFHNMENLLSA
jgi:hypothetical protein